jgi:hypothetical protein
MSKKSKEKPSNAKKAAQEAAKPKEGELPDYIRNKIWLKKYPDDYPKEVKIPTDKSIPEMMEEAADKWPDSVRVIFYGIEFTRKELKDNIDRLTTAFQKKLGIKKGDKIIGVKSGKSAFLSKIVVGCDGSNSVVARTAGFDSSHCKLLPSFRWRFKNCKNIDVKSAEFYLFEKLGVGYLWFYPFAGTKFNVGIGAINSPKMHAVFSEFVKTTPALKGAKVYYKGAEAIPYTGLLPKIYTTGMKSYW